MVKCFFCNTFFAAMRLKSVFSILLFSLCCCMFGCMSNTEPNTQDQQIVYTHPLAPPGKTTVFLDGVQYPFADNLNYAEYYIGDELQEEYRYYTDRGYHSFFNIDLNAYTNYVQFLLLDKAIALGTYELRDLGDSATAGPMSISYELDDSLTNTKVLKLKKGLLQITKVDIINGRLSGIYSCMVEDSSKKTTHTIEGSFTDIFYKNGAKGGEAMTAEVSGNNWTSKFTSGAYFHGFGNSLGQGVKPDYFAIYARTDESPADGYESLTIFIKKPIHPGTYDIDSGCTYYGKYKYDPPTQSYILTQGDTNTVKIQNAVIVSDYDVVRQRISGTFDYTIITNSSLSPLSIRNGRFIQLAWW